MTRKSRRPKASPQNTTRPATPIYFHRGVLDGKADNYEGIAPSTLHIWTDDGTTRVRSSYARTDNFRKLTLADGGTVDARIYMPAALVAPDGKVIA